MMTTGLTVGVMFFCVWCVVPPTFAQGRPEDPTRGTASIKKPAPGRSIAKAFGQVELECKRYYPVTVDQSGWLEPNFKFLGTALGVNDGRKRFTMQLCEESKTLRDSARCAEPLFEVSLPIVPGTNPNTTPQELVTSKTGHSYVLIWHPEVGDQLLFMSTTFALVPAPLPTGPPVRCE